LKDLRQRAFPGRLSFRAALELYGLTEADLAGFVRGQLEFLDFVDTRFKSGVLVPRPEIETYYSEVYLPQYRASNSASPPPLEDVDDVIEEILVEQRADPLLDDWLKQRRSDTRVVMLDSSMGPGENGHRETSPLIPESVSETAGAQGAAASIAPTP
jgi:hypothetical protein